MDSFQFLLRSQKVQDAAWGFMPDSSGLEIGTTCATIKPQTGGCSMKCRITVWASAGLLVAVCWVIYGILSKPPALTSADPILPLVRLTCPISNLGFYPLKLYWVLLANAATYALLGLIVETLRRRLRRPQPFKL